ncbi:MAG: prepilin-type N-terminal cleavage/methylation domain-containing protein [Phycisphaerae bacterium]|nr:prepilin-type N-terminal cleavage/methylation domain-containing protein [Phycisphaerae bacterium]
MRTHGRSAGRVGGAGFSLIEVLIAVFILSLGLLGLGAMFPVVIRSQRQGSDALSGVTAARAAEASLAGNDEFSRLTLDTTLQRNANFWQRWLGADDLKTDQQREFRFDGTFFLPAVDPRTGNVTFAPAGGTIPPVVVRGAARLHPGGSALPANPLFGWDLALKRQPGSGVLEAVVFVRRIDPKLRVAAGRSLFQVLTDTSIPQSERRVPFGAQPSGRPTLDGTGNYSVPATMSMEFRRETGKTDRLYLDQSKNFMWDYASQPGQTLVDNLGNIYSVVSVGNEGQGDFVRVTPAIPPGVPSTKDGSSTNGNLRIRQVVFTPQIPMAVSIVTVKP